MEREIETAFGGSFSPNKEGDRYLTVGERDDLFCLPTHIFDDEDIEWPDGTWIPLRSQHPLRLVVYDFDRDEERHMRVARRVFDALKAAGR